MSVPDGQIVQYHVECRVENGLIPLRLPELDIKAVFVVTDASVCFFDFSHAYLRLLQDQ
jgi:hypothetical protein